MVAIDDKSQIFSQIRSQIEFYFENYSLCRDSYMQNELKENENQFKVENFLKFNKIKQLGGESLSVEDLVKALKESKALKMNEDSTLVSRIKEVPADWKSYCEEADKRTVYLKGFATDSNLEAIKDSLKKAIDVSKIEGIFMRRTPKKTFKGSIYVTVADDESAKTLLESDKIELVGTEEFPAKRMMKCDHLKQQTAKNEKAKLEKLAKQIPKNSVMKITNLSCDSSERFDMKKMRESFSKFHPVEFVDQKETDNALVIYVRMKGENSITRFLEILSKVKSLEEVDERLEALHTLFGGKESFDKLEMVALEGEEELMYWKKIKENMQARHENKSKKGGNKFRKHQSFGTKAKKAKANDE